MSVEDDSRNMPITLIFLYIYYIKPQREFIKINTNECIKKVMAPINDEVNKKLQFFDKFTSTQFNNEIEEKTYLKAMSIMKVNCESAQGKINSIIRFIFPSCF